MKDKLNTRTKRDILMLHTVSIMHPINIRQQISLLILDMEKGFTLGNIMKYAKRYGNKEGKNRKDLLKILHYGIIMLNVHDTENS
jgi:hypothetical protein